MLNPHLNLTGSATFSFSRNQHDEITAHLFIIHFYSLLFHYGTKTHAEDKQVLSLLYDSAEPRRGKVLPK